MRVHFKKNIWLVLPVALSILLTGCGREDALEAGLQVQDTESILQDGPQKESGAETAEASESEIKPKSEEEAGSEAGPETEKETVSKAEPESAAGEERGNKTGAKAEEGTGADERVEEPLPPLTLLSEDWGLGFGEEGAQPVGNAPAEELKAYDAYFVGDENSKYIYLTFDCGYENGNTERILDALKKHKVPATFFVVGHFLESEPELVARMAQEGHAVGNHTWSHPGRDALLDPEEFGKELERVEVRFLEITGKELDRYYRPPAGKCMEDNLKMAAEMGYDTIFWSLAYVDWEQDHQPSHEEAFAKLTGRIHPGAVVLLHNTSTTNGEILDELLTRWEEMGYEFRPLSELARG